MNARPHASDSSEQRDAERKIVSVLEEELGVRLHDALELTVKRGKRTVRVDLDGFHEGDRPICVEAWAHQGRTIGSQPAKVMKDMCKLLHVEKLLGRPCRKMIVACNEEALAFLKNSWQGQFADEFGIERRFVQIDRATCDSVRRAQERQCR